MRKFIIQTVLSCCVALVASLCLTGCSKNEHPVEEANFTTLDIKTFSIDTLKLKLQSNDALLTDSLKAPDGRNTISVQYFDSKRRIRLTDIITGQLLLDTVVEYKSGFVNTLTFFQPSSGANFVWIGPPVDVPLPAADWLKMSITYTHPKLPDVVKVVIENSIIGGPDYKASDSFELKKGEFSRYFDGRRARRPRILLYTNDAQRKQVGQVDPSNFPVSLNPDYNIILLRNHTSLTGGVYFLNPEKLY